MSEKRYPALAVRGLKRTYTSGDRKLHVLQGADLDIWPGEMIGLIGPSGSGKSSLLHAAGLLERPDAGAVFIAGKEGVKASDLERTRLRRHNIGFVHQFHCLLPEFDARDNVALPQMIAGQSRSKARAEAERLLKLVGLGERMTHQPAQLSGGEQQRVAIARSLANKPKLLLADEPTGNLDPKTSATVFKALFEIAHHEGAAALVATHNLELTTYMDRVLTLSDGRVVELSRRQPPTTPPSV